VPQQRSGGTRATRLRRGEQIVEVEPEAAAGGAGEQAQVRQRERYVVPPRCVHRDQADQAVLTGADPRPRTRHHLRVRIEPVELAVAAVEVSPNMGVAHLHRPDDDHHGANLASRPSEAGPASNGAQATW